MEFREARHEELEELVQLLALVFDGGDRWFGNVIANDPWRARGRTWVAADGERLVANVQVHCRPIRYGAGRLVVGGIGHVATHPEYRHAGLASRLLRDQLAFMASSGYHLSLLYTGINPFYETFGWSTVPLTSRRLDLETWSAPVSAAGYAIERVRLPEELARHAGLYDACADAWVGPLDRTPEYWDASPSWTHGEFLGDDECLRAERDGSTVAYLRSRTMPDDSMHAAVDEIAWIPGEEPAAGALVAHFLSAMREAGKRIVDLYIGEEHPGFGATGGEGALEERVDRGAMFRVTNLVGLLTGAAPEFERRLRDAGRLRLAPLTLDMEFGCARIACDGSFRAEAHEGRPDLALEHAHFLELVLGRATAAELASRGVLDWTGEDRTEDLAALFPRRRYWYSRYDKF